MDHWLDAWINKDRNGNSYMSLKMKPKEGARDAPNPPRENPQAFQADLDDDVPFATPEPTSEHRVG